MRVSLLFSGLFLPLFSLAQFLHMPEEIKSIMDKSDIQYTIIPLTEFVPSSEIYPSSIPSQTLSKAPVSTSFSNTVNIQTQENVKKSQTKAKKLQNSGKFEKAISLYEKILVDNPSPQTLSEIAFCYDQLENYEQSIQWYQRLKKEFPTYTKAPVSLAQVYVKAEQYELALEEITLAHLNQPQDEAIFQQLVEIYAQQQQVFESWNLAPQFRLLSLQDKKVVNIAYKGEPWLAYANCKALWQYEPNYARDMVKISNVPSPIVEEKECLLNALIAYDGLEKEQKVNYPEMKALAKALKQKNVDGYILYEINLKNGQTSWQNLESNQQENILRYLKTIRSQVIQ